MSAIMGAESARKVVLVTGAPGAGKTSVAEPLAAALRFPLLSKDPIKEALFDALDGRAGDLAQSRKFSDAAIAVMLALAGQFSQVVLEANFHPHNMRERERIKSLANKIVEVYCCCPAEEMARRFAERAASTRQHPAHSLKSLSPELLAKYDGPIGIGTVIRIDTSRPVNINELAGKTREALSER